MPAFLSSISIKTMGWLLVVLLVTTFCFGMLSVVMYQNQTQIQQTLKETKESLQEEKDEVLDKSKQLSGCLGSIAQINQGIAENALAASLNETVSNTLAASTMALLPALIQKDKQVDPEPAAATAWFRSLFQ